MAKIDELVVELVAETSKLRAELKNAVNATEKASADMQGAIKEFTDNSSKDVSFFESSMATMAGFLGSQAVLGAFNAVKDAARFLGNELLEGAEGAIEEEKSFIRLANSLALIGNYSQSAQADMEEYVNSTAKLTAKTGEAVADTVSLLAAMTKLDNEGLKKATNAALDLSAAYGIDLESATRLVGKGVEGNVEAFKKFGITITEGANKSENLENILKGLATTQGSAAGAAKTFSGTLFGLAEAYDDVRKGVATSITQNEVFKAVIGEVAKIFSELTEEIGDSSGTLKKDMAEALIQVIELTANAILIFDALIRGVQGAYQIIQTVIYGIIETVQELWNVLADGEVSSDPFAATAESFKSVQDTFTSDTALSTVAEKLYRIGDAGKSAMGDLKEGTEGATEATVKHGKAIAEITAAEQARMDLLKSFATGLAEQGAAFDSYYLYQQELLASNLELEAITQEEYFTSKLDAMMTQFESEQSLLEESYAKKLITDQQYNDAKAALSQKQVIEARKFGKEQIDYDKTVSKQRADNLASTFSTIATLSESGNKELAAIGKAAAITTATIDGFAAVQKALASAPPPFNFALAALVGVATAANVAKISGVGLKGGIDSVPGTGSYDQYPAVLAPGERVVPSQTNKDLKQFLADQKKNGAGRTVTLNLTVQNNLPASREAGQQIIEVINEALANGSLRIDQAL